MVTTELRGRIANRFGQRHGIKIVAATPDSSTRFDRVDLSGPVAITVGTEKQGLTRTRIDQSDVAVAILMFGRLNSLNVATAAALMIYEAVRQRSS